MLMKFVDDSKENVPKRSESLIVGIKGDDMHQAQVQIPTEEPPPLPENDRLKAIGKRATRWDGNLKVSGSGKYTADIRLPGMLYAQMVDATVPHAKVVSIDTTEAEKMPRSEEHTSELQSPVHLVCRLLLEKKKHATVAF